MSSLRGRPSFCIADGVGQGQETEGSRSAQAGAEEASTGALQAGRLGSSPHPSPPSCMHHVYPAQSLPEPRCRLYNMG